MPQRLEEDEINVFFSVDTESLTVCSIVHWQENIEMKTCKATLLKSHFGMGFLL